MEFYNQGECTRLSQETVTYNLLSPEGEETPSGPDALSPRGQTTLTFVLIEHLCSSTRYYFRASAVNRAGQSVHGDLVQCMTLCKDECVVPGEFLLYVIALFKLLVITCAYQCDKSVCRNIRIIHNVEDLIADKLC